VAEDTGDEELLCDPRLPMRTHKAVDDRIAAGETPSQAELHGLQRSFADAHWAQDMLRGGAAPEGWEARTRETCLEAYMGAADLALLPAGGGADRPAAVRLRAGEDGLRTALRVEQPTDWVAILAAAIRCLMEAA
jgi:hypothetical protein